MEKEPINWERHWLTENQIMVAPVEQKIEKLMDLTCPAAVNAAFERWLEEWLIDELEKDGVAVLERNEEIK